jgi:hypothetical protein
LAGLTPLRTIVAILFVIEAVVLWQQGATAILPYLLMVPTLVGLVFPAMRGMTRFIICALAVAYAALFIFPGSILMAIGACGFLNSSCSDAAFTQGIAVFCVAAALNVLAAVLVVRRPAAMKRKDLDAATPPQP